VRAVRVLAGKFVKPGRVMQRHVLECVTHADRGPLRALYRAKNAPATGAFWCDALTEVERALLEAGCTQESQRCARATLQEAYAPPSLVVLSLVLSARPSSVAALRSAPSVDIAVQDFWIAAGAYGGATPLWQLHVQHGLRHVDGAPREHEARVALFAMARALRMVTLFPLKGGETAEEQAAWRDVQSYLGARYRVPREHAMATVGAVSHVFTYAGTYDNAMYDCLRRAALELAPDILLVTPTPVSSVHAMRATRLPSTSLADLVAGRTWVRESTALVLLHAHVYGVTSLAALAPYACAPGRVVIAVGDPCPPLACTLSGDDPEPLFASLLGRRNAERLVDGYVAGALGPCTAREHAALRAPRVARNTLPAAPLVNVVRRLGDVPNSVRDALPILVAGTNTMASARTAAAAIDTPHADSWLWLEDTGQLLRVVALHTLIRLPARGERVSRTEHMAASRTAHDVESHSALRYATVQHCDDGLTHRECCFTTHENDFIKLAAHPGALLCSVASPRVLARVACAPLADDAVLVVTGTLQSPCKASTADIRAALSLCRRTLYIVARRDYLDGVVLTRSGFAPPLASPPPSLSCYTGPVIAHNTDEEHDTRGFVHGVGLRNDAVVRCYPPPAAADASRFACADDLLGGIPTAGRPAARPPEPARANSNAWPAFEFPSHGEIATLPEADMTAALRTYVDSLTRGVPLPPLPRTLYCVCVLLSCMAVRGDAMLETWLVATEKARCKSMPHAGEHVARIRTALQNMLPLDEARAAAAERPVDGEDEPAEAFTRMLDTLGGVREAFRASARVAERRE